MRDERGQTSVLIIGFAFVLLLMVGVVVDASAAYLQRQGLDTLADGAALAGADEVRGAGRLRRRADRRTRAARRGRRPGRGARLPARGSARTTTTPGLSFDVAIRDRSVVVRVSAPLDLPVTVDGSPTPGSTPAVPRSSRSVTSGEVSSRRGIFRFEGTASLAIYGSERRRGPGAWAGCPVAQRGRCHAQFCGMPALEIEGSKSGSSGSRRTVALAGPGPRRRRVQVEPPRLRGRSRHRSGRRRRRRGHGTGPSATRSERGPVPTDPRDSALTHR